MPDLGKRITFVELLDECHRIEVPQLQRDYAQGRETAKEVRDGFLDALHGALVRPRDDAALPLNLDFVYGSMEDNNGKFFLPLDGQQRLTTLFLLHWYLAWRDDDLSTFQRIIWNGRHSRFSYAVRPSSAEFFDELAQYVPDCPPGQLPSVRKLLENQHWFYLHWRLDPTIQSVLTMLDAIHRRFREHDGLFSRLLYAESPAITFQLLPLEHFGLSDDLYIKMNARGKPLTAFETFKARFEQHLEELYPVEQRHIGDARLSVHEFFSRRMDTLWTDFFWSYRTSTTTVFDQAAMNLFWIVAWVSTDPDNPAPRVSVARYRQTVGSYSEFHDLGLLTRPFANNLICLLEAWSAGGGRLQPQLPDARYFDESAFFARVSTSPTSVQYSELVLFAAFVSYLSSNEGAVDAADLQAWMRIVFNLVQNSDIERPDEYERCLSGLRKLLPHSRRVLQYVATMDPMPLGFSREQVQEESLKAKLLLAHADWEERIHVAEAHGYFRGQIGFLFDFAGVGAQAEEQPIEEWSLEVHGQLQSRFDEYFDKAKVTFNEGGLAPLPGEPYQWQRSLLAIGNYLVRIGRNYSFLTNPASGPDSWKRFLRGGTNASGRQHLKTLWDRLDLSADLESQLAATRDTSDLEPWRAAMVGHPQAMDYCGQHEIRWEEGAGEIYLLKRRQMNGAHAELFSYVLHVQLSTKECQGRLAPLKLEQYQSVTMTEAEPQVLLTLLSSSTAHFSIESADGQFQILVPRAELGDIPGAAEILMEGSGFTHRGEVLRRLAPRDEIHDTLFQLAARLAEVKTT